VGCSLFVYWHVAPGDQPAAEAATRALQQRWREQERALEARLYRRTDEAHGRVTLMETYAAPGGLSRQLQALLIEEGSRQLAHLALSGRHVERFEPAD
jgi:hypothetical protein